MSLLVVGSIALDTVETPVAKAENVFGGSAAYLSYAASFFTPVRLVGVAGNDLGEEMLEVLAGHNIDVSGLEIAEGPTFRWHGKYAEDPNLRETISVALNVLGSYIPKIPENFRDTPFVFLANADPKLQSDVMDQMTSPRLVVNDSMNFYIENSRAALEALLKKVGGFYANDEEVKLLTGDQNVLRGARKLLDYGPDFILLKKGEHGAALVTKNSIVPFPAYPLCDVCDPTGAGDSFGGGMLGYLAETGDLSFDNLKRAVAYGTVIASFACEAFSLDRLKGITRDEIEKRFDEYTAALSLIRK